MRVLYVEDFVAWRDRIVATYLSTHDVVLCDSVAEARTHYGPGRFDAVLLDYELPDGTGADVARMIRAAGDPVPIVSNSSSSGRNRLMLSLGANYAVNKSSEAQLEGVLDEIAAQSQR